MNSAIKWRPKLMLGICYAVIGAILFIIYAPNFCLMPGRDSGAFLYVAQNILQGKLPYADLWDHKPPMVFWIDALGLYLGKGSVIGVRMLEYLFLFTAALCGFNAARILFGILPAFAATLVWIVCLTNILEGGNLTEVYALLFQFSGLLLFVLAEQKQKYLCNGLISGVLSAWTFFLKQNLIGFWVALALLFCFQAVAANDFRILKRKLLPVLSGAFMTILIVVGYFALHNALPQFWENTFLYNFAYSSSAAGIAAKWQAIAFGFSKFKIAALFFLSWVSAFFFLVKKRHVDELLSTVMLLMVVWLPLELVLSAMSGRTYAHYFIALLPVYFLLYSFFSYLILDYAQYVVLKTKNWQITSGQMLVVALLFLKGLLYGRDIVRLYEPPATAHYPVEEMAAYIGEQTDANDFVLVWGGEPVLNFVTERLSPSRFFYQYPLVAENYSEIKMLGVFFNEINVNKPHIIVDTRNDLLPPLSDVAKQKRWLNGADKKAVNIALATELSERFAVFIAKNYQLDQQIGPWLVYKKHSLAKAQ